MVLAAVSSHSLAHEPTTAGFGQQSRIELLCTDFDGTLFPGDSQAIDPALWLLLERLVKQEQVFWVINTGRTWEGLSFELRRLSPPVWPHWVVLGEREVYRVGAGKAEPHRAWNELCRRAHRHLFEKAKPFWRELLNYLASSSQARVSMDQPWSPVEIEASSEEEADAIHGFVAKRLSAWPGLSLVRNSRWFRFAHRFFHKGTALACIQREMDIKPEGTLAIGDHYNDLPMLEPCYARYLACPSNAIPSVKEKVRRYGGRVASREAAGGVLEVLEKLCASGHRER
jgi:hydroxymethylpyrimidine pyrophosphatase-like HAD family hydrolase